MKYLKAQRYIGDVPTFVPVPAKFMRILQRFLGIDVEPNGGAGGIGGRVGEDDAG